METTPDLTALVLVGSLKSSEEPSSSEVLGRQVLAELGRHGVTGTVVRLADHDIKPGVEIDMGSGDEWPAIRERILAADILVMATPIWMGQPSSVTKRALERLAENSTHWLRQNGPNHCRPGSPARTRNRWHCGPARQPT